MHLPPGPVTVTACGFPAAMVAAEPGRRFAFQWLPEPGDLVEITLTPEGAGTLVRR
ncbi:hypothetical protein OHA74_05535 [Streptomyces phaeochromogenes]|uniref:hypothetical protein n=1 Tax=Streptomyces phaeochromogenes TaxID=1923 RepID=UPI002E2A3516|nr:hypothetical protein [Streptomyces phaeochromogenes]